MKTVALVLLLLTAGCFGSKKSLVGAGIGAVGGGTLGYLIGGEDHRTSGLAIGAAVGLAIGAAIGFALELEDSPLTKGD